MENLRILGTQTKYPQTPNEAVLETFENPEKERDYSIKLSSKEFSSLCPKTAQPDFYSIQIEYWPKEKCLESKSLKLYLFSYRQTGMFIEALTNKIADDVQKIIEAKRLIVTNTMNPRGGIPITVKVVR